MVGVSFSFPQLLKAIYTGQKDQTIRPVNPKRIDQMQRLGIQLYWKQRSKYGFRLSETKYKEGYRIMFRDSHCGMSFKYTLHWRDYHSGWWNSVLSWQRGEIAKRDGFDTFQELTEALESRYGDIHNMEFDLIRWPRLKKPHPRLLQKWEMQMMFFKLIKSFDEVKWMEKYEDRGQ